MVNEILNFKVLLKDTYKEKRCDPLTLELLFSNVDIIFIKGGVSSIRSLPFVNTAFKLGPSSWPNAPEISYISVYYMDCYTA